MEKLRSRKIRYAAGLLLGCVAFEGASASMGPTPGAETIAEKLRATSLPFIENKGQLAADNVSFYAHTFGGTVFVTNNDELVYALPRAKVGERTGAWSFREVFINGRHDRPNGDAESSVKVSSFTGNDSTRWRQDIATFNKIDLGNIYNGIAVKVRAAGNNVEKLFYVAPGADPRNIKVRIDGVKSISRTADGRLNLKTDLGDVAFTAPIAYQVINGKKETVQVAYVVKDDQYGFELGDYDRSRELVIDPLLASTFIGGHDPNVTGNYDDDIIYGVVAQGGYVYAAGVTQSPDFPVALGLDDTYNGGLGDAFITKMTDDLSTVVASTYLGTQYRDSFRDLTVDASGILYAAGEGGYGFPVTPGAYTYNGSSLAGGGVVVKMSDDLMTLIASAIVVPYAYPRTIAFGNNGVYFGGRINSPNLPVTPNAYDPTCGSDGKCDPGGFYITEYYGFAGKLDANLQNLLAATYLDNAKDVTGVAVASDSSVFVSDGFDYAINGSLVRFDDNLTARLAYLELPGRTYFHDVVAGDGYIITAGQTYSADLPTVGTEYDTGCGTDGACDPVGTYNVPTPDAFVARYSYDLQTVQALTYLGGSGIDSARSVNIDNNGDILVTGETASSNFPVSSNGYDSSANGSDDVFVAKLSSDFKTLQYASYLGGSGDDHGNVVTMDADNLVYIAGNTASTNFPTTTNAFDRSYNGGTSDAFISKFDTLAQSGGGGGGGGATNQPPIADAGADQNVASRSLVYLDGRASTDSDGQIVAYQWRQVSGRNVTLNNANTTVANFVAPRVRKGRSTVLVFELTVTDDQGATASDQVVVTVN